MSDIDTGTLFLLLSYNRLGKHCRIVYDAAFLQLHMC